MRLVDVAHCSPVVGERAAKRRALYPIVALLVVATCIAGCSAPLSSRPFQAGIADQTNAEGWGDIEPRYVVVETSLLAADGSPIESRSYDFDENGNLRAWSNETGSASSSGQHWMYYLQADDYGFATGKVAVKSSPAGLIEDASGSSDKEFGIEYDYDAAGRPAVFTERSSSRTYSMRYEYHDNGRLAKEANEGGSSYLVEYDDEGKVTLSGSQRITWNIGQDGTVQSIECEQPNREPNEYVVVGADEAGNITAIVGPEGNIYKFRWELMEKPSRAIATAPDPVSQWLFVGYGGSVYPRYLTP